MTSKLEVVFQSDVFDILFVELLSGASEGGDFRAGEGHPGEVLRIELLFERREEIVEYQTNVQFRGVREHQSSSDVSTGENVLVSGT